MLRPLLGSTHTTQRDTVTHTQTTPARPLFLHGTSFVRQRRRVANCLSNHILHICNRRRRFSSLCLRGSVPGSWGECILLADAPSVSTARLCHCQHLQPQTQLPPSLSGRYHTPKSPAVRLRKCHLIIPSTMSSPTHTSHVSRSSTARGENMKPVVSLRFCLLHPQMPPRRSVDSVQSDAHFSRFQVKHRRWREHKTGCEFMALLCPPNAASLQCRLPMPAQPPNQPKPGGKEGDREVLLLLLMSYVLEKAPMSVPLYLHTHAVPNALLRSHPQYISFKITIWLSWTRPTS